MTNKSDQKGQGEKAALFSRLQVWVTEASKDQQAECTVKKNHCAFISLDLRLIK